MLSHLGLADRTKFRRKYIHRLLQVNIIELTIPDKPNSQHQKYRLTPKGLQLKKLLEKEQVICTCQKKAVPSRAPTSFARPLKCTFTSPPRKYVREMQPILLAFGKPVAKNDARVIRRRLPPLSPLTHEVRGGPILSRIFLKNRLCLFHIPLYTYSQANFQ